MATDELAALEAQAFDELKACNDEAALRAWYAKFLGEKGLMEGRVQANSGRFRRTKRRRTGRK